MNKFKITKGFCLWFTVGIILYIIFTGAFTFLSVKNTKKIELDSLINQAEQITLEGNRLTSTGSDCKLFFTSDTKFTADYLDIKVSDLSENIAYAHLFYSDTQGQFNGQNSIRFAVTNGLNEVNFKPSKYLRLDITNKENVSLTIDSLTLRSAKNPVYQIPQSLILFLISWLLLYMAGSHLGLCYKGTREGIVFLIEAAFAVFMTVIMLFSLGGFQYRFITLVLIPLCTLAAAKLYARLNVDKVRAKFAVPIVLLCMTIIMCIVGWKTLSTITTDLGAVYYSAWEVAEHSGVNNLHTGEEIYSLFFEGSNNDYFVRYHNNIALLGILAVFYKVLSFFSLTADHIMSNYMSVLLNIAFIMTGVLFGLLAAKNWFGKKGMLTYLIMSALFVPYYIHACRFYTDTMSLPFVTLIMWLYSIPDEKFRFKYLKYLLLGAVICAGALVKGSIMLVIVALVAHLILCSIKNIKFAVVAVITLLVLNSAWNAYIVNCDWVNLSKNEKLEFPLTHWIMMGVNTDVNGGYSQSDFEYTDSFPTKDEKLSANVEVIMRRFGEFDSLSDFADYEFSKAALTWGDGQYMQNNHIEWGINKGKIYDFISVSGSQYSMYNIYIVVFAFCMYIFAVAGGVFNLKENKSDCGMFLRLTMLGVIFFFMMWESKSRYILNFTPVFMLAAIYGLEEIKTHIFNK